MTNRGGLVVGWLILAFAIILGYANSYLIMMMINATTTMWVMWVSGIILLISGSFINAISK